jgi:hypothetical protein
MLTEQWKPTKDYEGLYEISNIGRIRSVDRIVNSVSNNGRKAKGKILKTHITRTGYYNVILSKGSKQTNFNLHILVWDAFGVKKRNGRLLQVDHIDNNRLNNWIGNLQLLTARENNIKRTLQLRKRNNYTGVTLYNYKGKSKWRAGISIAGKGITIGYYNTEDEARLAYENFYEKAKRIFSV